MRRKRSRYQRAKRLMHDLLAAERPARTRPKSKPAAREAAVEHAITEHEQGFSSLHWMTAGLFLAAGAEAALGERRGDYRAGDAVRWAPLVAAPLASAVQALRALHPTSTTRTISKLVNGVALGIGAAGLASSISHALRADAVDDEDSASAFDRIPSFAPLAFGAVGLLGLLLDTEEEEAAEAVAPPKERKRSHGQVQRIRIRV